MRRVKVLLLDLKRNARRWSEDIHAYVGDHHELAVFDEAQPLEPQFQNVEVVIDMSGLVGTRPRIDAAVAAGVKLWQIVGTGLDHVDVAYFLERGMPLANTPGQFSSIALAEHALFFMLYFAKEFQVGQKNVRSQVFFQPMTEELNGKTLGLVGLGASGRDLAKRAWSLGMRIMAVDTAELPKATLDLLHIESFGPASELHNLLAESDYVSLHVPLTPSTQYLINQEALDRMKPTAVLINVARGRVVDEEALVWSLQTGRIKGAGLDVFTDEPLDPSHPLLQMDNVAVTPHVAGGTTGTSRRRAQAAAENVDRIAEELPSLYQITSIE